VKRAKIEATLLDRGDRDAVGAGDIKLEKATAVRTRTTVAAPADEVWDSLLFYEELEERPPFLLRRLLPVPLGTEGCKSEVGDTARCLYERGHLIKRVTRADRAHSYAFEVVEQQLAVGGGLRLTGGGYTLRQLPGERTQVTLETRYLSRKHPRWFWKRLETAVCHRFHRHLLAALSRRVEAASRSAGVPPASDVERTRAVRKSRRGR
jgi:hypothetical protein